MVVVVVRVWLIVCFGVVFSRFDDLVWHLLTSVLLQDLKGLGGNLILYVLVLLRLYFYMSCLLMDVFDCILVQLLLVDSLGALVGFPKLLNVTVNPLGVVLTRPVLLLNLLHVLLYNLLDTLSSCHPQLDLIEWLAPLTPDSTWGIAADDFVFYLVSDFLLLGLFEVSRHLMNDGLVELPLELAHVWARALIELKVEPLAFCHVMQLVKFFLGKSYRHYFYLFF